MPVLSLTYYPWITQHVEAALIRESVVALANLAAEQLSQALGEPWTIQVGEPISVPTQIAQISNGQCQIALMNPVGLAFAQQRNPAVQVLAIALRMIDGKPGNTYFGQLYVNRKTAIADGADPTALEAALPWPILTQRLRGRTLAFGSSQSTSNFLMPAYLLWRNGIHPFTAFHSATFVGGHDSVAAAVYRGEFDVGAGHDGVILDLSRQYGFGDAKDQLSRIARISILSDPVAVNLPDKTLMEPLRGAFAKAVAMPAGLAALQAFWGGALGLGAPPDNAFASLLQAVNALGLREADMMTA